MEHESYKYMKSYISKNYPMYYSRLEKSSFYAVILNSVYKEYGSNAIRRGYADKVIDELVNEYAQKNLYDIWNNYNNMYNYVKKVAIIKNNFLVREVNSTLLDSVIKKITLKFIDSDKISDKFISGECDKLIISEFEYYSNDIYNKCFVHVKDILDENYVKQGCNLETYNHILELVMLKLLDEKNAKDIIDGVHDELIVEKYDAYVKKVKRNVVNYVKRILSEMEFSFGIPEEQVIEFVMKNIFDSGKMSAVNLFNSGLDDYIMSYASQKQKNNEVNSAKRRIYSLISGSNNLEVVRMDLPKVSDYIYDLLISQHRCSPRGIASGRYDELIMINLNKILMKSSSIKNDTTPHKIKHKTKKRKMPSLLKKLLIVGVVAGSIGVGVLGYNLADDIRYIKASEDISSFDEYNYTYIWAEDNDRVEPTAVNALNFYNKVNNLGLGNGVYEFLGFHKAYNKILQDKLYVADEMIWQARLEANNNSLYEKVYNEIENCSCFLEFAMDRLYDMGYDEIKEEKYTNALIVYKEAMKDSSVEVPMDSDMISKDNKKLIHDIIDLYNEYSEKATVRFSKILPQVDDEDSLNNSSGVGRKI